MLSVELRLASVGLSRSRCWGLLNETSVRDVVSSARSKGGSCGTGTFFTILNGGIVDFVVSVSSWMLEAFEPRTFRVSACDRADELMLLLILRLDPSRRKPEPSFTAVYRDGRLESQ